MTLALILAIGIAGAIVAAWGMYLGGEWVRRAVILGSVALFAVLVVALVMDAPRLTEAGIVTTDGWFRDRIVPTDYLRLVTALWALDSVVIVGIAWLLGGSEELRGLLPATLAGIAGGVVALGATDLSIGIAASGVTGLLSLAVLRSSDRSATSAVAARELRIVLGAAVLLLVAVAVAPVAAALVLSGVSGGSAADLPSPGGPGAAGEAGAILGLVALAISAGVAARFGAVPFHFRVPRLVDAVEPISVPLLLAWLPLPVGVVGLATLDSLVGPLALRLDGERSLIVAVALVTMAAGALAAYLADDLRHTVGYLVVADIGLVLLGFAALDPAAWGPTRVWLVAIAGSKSALAAWAAVAESRFETRRVGDLRGWARHGPILAAGFVLTVLATYGLPGWIVLEARLDLARLVGAGRWAVPLVIAGLLTLPVYIRILAIGLGPMSSHVQRSAPERVTQERRRVAARSSIDGPKILTAAAIDEAAAEGGEDAVGVGGVRRTAAGGIGPATHGPAALAGRFLAGVRRDRTELISAGVLALAVLATLTAWGALSLGSAAREPAPIVTGPSTD